MRGKSEFQMACGSTTSCSQLSLAEPSVGKPFTRAAHLQDCPSVDQSYTHWDLQQFYAISNTDCVYFNHSSSWYQNHMCPVRPPTTPLLGLLDRGAWRGCSGRLSGLLLAQLTWSCWEGAEIQDMSWETSQYPLHHHVLSWDAWSGSELDVSAEDNSSQCCRLRPGKQLLAGTAWKLSSGPFQQGLFGEASLISRNTFSCCLVVAVWIWQFLQSPYWLY